MAIERYYRAKDLPPLTGQCKSQIYNLIREGKFPKPLKLGKSSIWREQDIENWQKEIAANGGMA